MSEECLSFEKRESETGYERASKFLYKMIGHSVGNTSLNRRGLEVLREADRLHQLYPESDSAELYIRVHGFPVQRGIAVNFFRKVERARKWQAKSLYWCEFTQQEAEHFQHADEFIKSHQYSRAYHVLSVMYSHYRIHLGRMFAPAPIQEISIPTVRRWGDSSKRYTNKKRITSKKRF